MTSDSSTPTASKALLPASTLQALAAGIILLAVALRLFLIFSTRATEEDFYITLRYAENIAQGRGFVYNPGESVLGATTPLYTLLLASFAGLHLDPILGGKLFAVGADAVTCWLLIRYGAALNAIGPGLWAALIFAAAPLNLIESVKGMEVSLVACAAVASWYFWQVRREGASWTCTAALALLRPDGLVLALILLAASLLRDRRFPARGVMLFGLLLLPWTLYAFNTFGSPVPASLRAKLIVYGWHNRAPFPNLIPFFQLMLRNPLSLVIFLGCLLLALQFAVVVRAAARSGKPYLSQDRVMWLAAPFVWMAAYYSGMAFSHVFLFGWYFLPPTPIYYLAGSFGWAIHLEKWRPGIDWERLERVFLPFTLAFAALLMCLVFLPRAYLTLKHSQEDEETLRIPIGTWLRANASPGDTVMLEPIGYIGYFSGLRVLDTVGLVSPEALPAYRRDNPSPYHTLWKQYLPEWVLLRRGEWNDLEGYESTLPGPERLTHEYLAVHRWPETAGAPAAFLLFHRKTPEQR